MIVISGALVLVALVLLVLGLTMQDLNFVYGSIAVSLVSFVFLVIGILQRRGEQSTPAATGPEVRDDSAPAPAPAPEPAAAAPAPAAPAPRTSRRATVAAPAPEPQDVEDEPVEGGGAVLVVPGRPRYHIEGCRYLAGKAAEQVDVLDARADGFTACGVCKPDLALVEEPADIFSDVDVPAEEPADEVVDSGVPGTEDAVEEPVAAPAGTSRRGSRRVAEAAPARPAKKAPAKKAAAKRAPAKPAATAEPAEAAAPAAPARARRAGRVVVIPDRGRFHTADCRFVRGVEGTEELTRTQATRQGFQPCGVCKPA